MKRSVLIASLCLGATILAPLPIYAQRDIVARGVTEARQSGDEAALVHLAEQVGAAGIAECLEHANRSGRLICAETARHLEHPWSVLPILATVLQDHDRQIASRAADSMVTILSSMQSADLGEQEPLPDELETLLQGLRGVAASDALSLDIRAQVVAISGALARMVGAGLEVSREALRDPEVAIRRAALSSLISSTEPADIEAMSRAAVEDRDLQVAAQAAAGVCEATLRAGVTLPAPVEERIRALLQDERARPSVILPTLVCIVRSRPEATNELRELADRHPNEASRTAWAELTSEED